MNDISKKRRDGVDIGPASIKALLDAPVILPGENEVDYATLSSALRADLAPQAVFEELIVADIIDLEWEKWRWKRMIGIRIDYKMRQLLNGLFRSDEFIPFSVFTHSEVKPEKGLVNAVMKVGTKKENCLTHAQAIEYLREEYQLSIDDVMAEAFSLAADEIQVFERNLQSCETRRRKLYDELHTVRADRAMPVEDVEFELDLQ